MWVVYLTSVFYERSRDLIDVRRMCRYIIDFYGEDVVALFPEMGYYAVDPNDLRSIVDIDWRRFDSRVLCSKCINILFLGHQSGLTSTEKHVLGRLLYLGTVKNVIAVGELSYCHWEAPHSVVFTPSVYQNVGTGPHRYPYCCKHNEDTQGACSFVRTDLGASIMQSQSLIDVVNTT